MQFGEIIQMHVLCILHVLTDVSCQESFISDSGLFVFVVVVVVVVGVDDDDDDVCNFHGDDWIEGCVKHMILKLNIEKKKIKWSLFLKIKNQNKQFKRLSLY